MRKYLIVSIILLCIGCGESLEDTYSRFGSEGTVRYLSKCKNVTVEPGWNRLIVNWENPVDPVVDNIMVRWEANEIADSVILDNGTTEYSINNLEDGTYKVSIASVDSKNNRSLFEDVYTRPFTKNHDSFRSFSTIVSKHFFVKDRLILFFADWQDNVDTATVHYTKFDGEKGHLGINEQFTNNNPYYLLPESIQANSDVYIERDGKIDGCDDVIPFDDYYLDRVKRYSADFKKELFTRYGTEEVAEVGTITQFGYDYDVSTFEDILYLDDLKTFSLGENRYLYDGTLMIYNINNSMYYNGIALIPDMNMAAFVLKVAAEVMGVSIERYNSHYFPGKKGFSYMKEMGNPTKIDNVSIPYTQDWDIKCMVDNTEFTDAELGRMGEMEYLFDDNVSTIWNPSSYPYHRTYEIIVDFQKATKIKGFEVVQSTTDNMQSAMDDSERPKVIRFEASNDSFNWKQVTHALDVNIGNTNGEISVINLKEETETRYVKISINDLPSDTGSTFTVALSDIVFF